MPKLTRQGLIRKNWQLCREIVKLIRGENCELCGTEGREVDHCFSRGNKEAFYLISNLSLLCSECHSHKTYRRYGFDLKVYEHVIEREGLEEFKRIRAISEKKGGFPDWQYMVYHEQQNLKLKEQRALIMAAA